MRDDRPVSPTDYEIEAKNAFFRVNRSIVESEIRPGNTVSFLKELDLTEIERIRQTSSERPTYTAFVVKAVALALKEHPYANRRVAFRLFSSARLQRFHHSDVAVACERNLPGDPAVAFIDILRDADRLSLEQISGQLRAMATCDETTNPQWHDFSQLITRLPHWLATLLIRLPFFSPRLWATYRGAAALISSPAKYGVDVVVGTWTHPLGVSFGLVQDRPVVRDKQIVIRPTMTLSLNFDRRVMDGAHAARLFARLSQILEKASTEMFESLPRAKSSEEVAVFAGRQLGAEAEAEKQAEAEPAACKSALEAEELSSADPVVLRRAGPAEAAAASSSVAPREKQARKRRVLFFAEGDLARPIALARSLDPRLYDVVLAWDARFEKHCADLPFPVRIIASIPTDQFIQSLDRGSPVYDVKTLRSYVREDLEVIRETQPDIVVGDFRLSLSVSARLAGVTYMAITDACWSPYGRQRYPLGEHPMVRLLGVTAAQAVFSLIRPLALAYHCRPLNRVRRKFGLPSLGYDLRHVYTDADEVLYTDIPELAPLLGLPENHHYLGPVSWSPGVSAPPWWGSVPQDRPVISVTFGTAGHSERLLPLTLKALADLPVTVIAATAGRMAGVSSLPGNALLADFLDGEKAAALSRLVICNGETLSVQQALCARVPVLGIASNMNQHLNMRTVRRTGAGELLRAGTATAESIRAVVMKMLAQPAYGQAAAALAEIYARYDAGERFRERIAACSSRGRSNVVPFAPRPERQKPVVRELEPAIEETAAEAEAYDQFDRLYGEILYQGFAESALRMGVAGGRVLDVSGGSPRIAIRLARLNPRFSFEVMVLSTTMKQLAQRCVAEEKLEDRVRVCLWDAKQLPFEPGSFDLVISNNMLHRVRDPLIVLREIHRVASSRGALLIRDVRRLPSPWMGLLLPLYCLRYDATLKRVAEGAFRAALSYQELAELLPASGLERARITKYFVTSIGVEVPALSFEPSLALPPVPQSLALRLAKSLYVSRSRPGARASAAPHEGGAPESRTLRR
ncbi:MAG TPA: 2-oxo acid dehydrogenase subunit E2 [Thermoanaerobaculia bacterium]|nr:2-oxo acid dehydrogenase subunit E2 [Thermoanaerobaculia bacterium]